MEPATWGFGASLGTGPAATVVRARTRFDGTARQPVRNCGQVVHRRWRHAVPCAHVPARRPVPQGVPASAPRVTAGSGAAVPVAAGASVRILSRLIPSGGTVP